MAVLTLSESVLHEQLRAPQQMPLEGALHEQLQQLQVWLNEMVVANTSEATKKPASPPPSEEPKTANEKPSTDVCCCAPEQGFFRRSIQQKIQYRPCTKNQQCSILRINRNRCQYCRLKKCIAVGMSRDAVRFGRVPKREKARILAAMQQSSISRSVEKVLAAELEDECALYHNVVRAHLDTCDFTREKVEPMLARAREQPSYTACPPTLACPLNPNPVPLTGQQELLQDFSKRFSPAIRGVVEFAKRIPGFILLGQDDQVTLLKAGVFEVLLVRLACLFDSQTNSMVCLNGQVLKRESIHNSSNARFLMDSMFDFAERLNALRLSDAEVGLFCSIVVIAADRPGLRNTELVERMQSKLRAALQIVINQNHPGQSHIMHDLMKKIPDLRTLNTLHSEKLLAFKMTEQQQQQQHHQQQQQQQQHMWGSMMMCAAEVDDSSKSPAGSSSWSSASDVTMDEVVKSPLGSVSSSESVCSGEVASLTDYPAAHNSHASSAPLLAATLAGAALCPHRHRANSGSTSGEDDMAAHNPLSGAGSASRALSSHPHSRFHRKLDSPSDSGIESGTEKLDKAGPNSAPTSVCSSPRSSLEDKDEHSHQSSHVEDMPVLKRVLQAPPLYDTNSLMDEAYKPHKKFRALRHKDSAEAEAMVVSPAPAPVPAPVAPPANVSPLTSSLSSTHSTLARSLMEGPRMTAEQLKRTDIIHNFIMGNPVDLASSTQQHVLVAAPPTYHYIPQASPQPQQRWPVAGVSTATVTAPAAVPVPQSQSPLSGVITSAPAASACPYAAAAGSPSPPHEFSRLYPSPQAASPSSTSPSPLHRKSPACSPESSTPPAPLAPKLVELQVGIAANSQPLNLSKKSPSPSPRPLSAPAPHKVLSLEA